jgi:hypothetical protein
MSFLDGGFPGYGCPTAGRFGAQGGEWQAAMASPGAMGMSQFAQYWSRRAWWALDPAGNAVRDVTSGGPPDRADSKLVRTRTRAALARDAQAMYVYFPGAGSAEIDVSRIRAARATARWIDPSTGTVVNTGTVATSTPLRAATPAGWRDALLEISVDGAGGVLPTSTGPDGPTAGAAPTGAPSPGGSPTPSTSGSRASSGGSSSTSSSSSSSSSSSRPEPTRTTTTSTTTARPRTVALSSLRPASASNGLGPVETNMSNGEAEAGDGYPLSVGGHDYDSGLGVHAKSVLEYNLGGSYSVFRSDVGVDDEVGGDGSVTFLVLLDGEVAFESEVLYGGDSPVGVDLDVEGVRVLRLEVHDAGDGTDRDHADWAGARLTR